MPATRSKKRRSVAANATDDDSRRTANGLYVHSSPPKVLQVHPGTVRQWIRAGDVGRLERLVLEGHGHKLAGEYSPDPKVRSFLKRVPAYSLKINELHDAMNKRDEELLGKLFEPKAFESPMKNVFTSKNSAGVSLLHKAAFYGYPEIVRLLAVNFPKMIDAKDGRGKTALHYCGASKDAARIWSILTNAGADAKIADSKGRLPSYYVQRPDEIRLPEEKIFNEIPNGLTPPAKNGLIVRPSNIRIWIHDRDLDKLQQVVWEGHGSKLRVETSNNPKMKRFLEGVPHVLNAIKDVHSAVVEDDFEEFFKKTSDPAPVDIFGSKDANGLNPLHKAAGLGRRQIAELILRRNPKLVFAADNRGRTPLHFAAALRDGGAMYDFLVENNADETVFDNNGKTPAFYKSNPKEISSKMLETIPEAPRTSIAFPPAWDWNLFRSEGSSPVPNPDFLGKENSTAEANGEKSSDSILGETGVAEAEDDGDGKEDPSERDFGSENVGSAKVRNERVEDKEEEEKEKEKEEEEEENRDSARVGETVDIWTNEDVEKNPERETEREKETDEFSEKEEELVSEKEENLNEQGNEENEGEEVLKIPGINYSESEEISNENSNGENREKTEREIAEERQRLLDEGLVKIGGGKVEEEEDPAAESEDLIRNGDMEKLARMVLDGRGDRLLGKKSDDPEIQSFLDNLPAYMAKIGAVHAAARSGSLRDLQGALDRRRFAVAKESTDKLGATPLHVAVLFGKSQIVKYLGGRFPETLDAKDRSGRTPLHYAAALPDNSYLFNVLLNLGADRKISDDAGHVAGYYRENPGEWTLEKLLEEYDASARVANDMLADREHPLFGPEDGKYLANALGGPLIRGLTEIANKRPASPIAYLADFLYDFLNENKGPEPPGSATRAGSDELEADDEGDDAGAAEPSFDEASPSRKSRSAKATGEAEENADDADDADGGSLEENGPRTTSGPADRDEYGQTVLHFAAARSHGRNGLFQLIRECGANLGHRDELYRTARDIAVQADITKNIEEIDKYVLSLAAGGQTEKLIELYAEGYEHILDVADDENNDVIAVASAKNHEKTLAFLKVIPSLEEKREEMHGAIRAGEGQRVEDIIGECKNGRLVALGKNSTGRCSLHIAVLCQQKEIAEFIAQKYPETLRIGDNLERTPLHYAMAVAEVESLSKILIKCGAKRVSKDLKGRQPTYYFMNKSEILKLQEEEYILRA